MVEGEGEGEAERLRQTERGGDGYETRARDLRSECNREKASPVASTVTSKLGSGKGSMYLR